ncbi:MULTISPECIES: ATP-binding cassette domain-containing protein [Caproicibacterium]|uniref:ATP-binding cassette domain-containing protein n=1 Tax=Caproicibacterium argilliputei TaxID=3030016 RepID=A0AA97H3U6_9FIRM|nr:ATP-binding cassette domain-containing protein [Caproicibacterium argilliputei]WOC32688.1 ATP-binding cassette domain-containing protein [Caproicibacterium argilliputei]
MKRHTRVLGILLAGMMVVSTAAMVPANAANTTDANSNFNLPKAKELNENEWHLNRISLKMEYSHMENVLQVSNLKKEYPGFVLDNLSFAIPRGTITGFIGRNGAGKSTTLKCILGLMPSYNGRSESLRRNGKAAFSRSKRPPRVVLDPEQLYENLKVKEMNKILSRAYTQWDNDTCSTYLKRFGIDQNKTISKLSSGIKKQLCIFMRSPIMQTY